MTMLTALQTRDKEGRHFLSNSVKVARKWLVKGKHREDGGLEKRKVYPTTVIRLN